MTAPADCPEVFLQPGDIWFGSGQVRLRTILGSCVAITLWHPQRRIGGMCHFMLPEPLQLQLQRGKPDGRYATDAMQILLRRMDACGTRPEQFEVKLFGGGRMFPSMDRLASGGVGAVQERNVEMARELAAQHGLQIKAEDLGGSGHRQVLFDIDDGAAWVKHTPLAAPSLDRPKAGASR